ncbi:RNA modification enzyme, MiaB family [Solidesulfovibrio carbinoliphilus subsp. oakridgensis]|uniref:RNA modification enzyme, MiaB family n=1 Tax=Solidesulfovibrio carbinoliphilus subsp. oakridgensis TaxID=694327 RepID=G7Q8Z9_9BACT|nr:MiaB/RimO family radical SAM methylthiotransferase [Solidesulfovibrio carbinoliphilus]EHJ47485.1 RNA modification enzyme, MiaB family [Solidesulfovibrio carbinoliphilus subsp. oakridgensis]
MDLGPGLCYAPPMPHASPKRFCLVTLGCKVNQYESRALAEAWLGSGLVRTDDPAAADLVVLCSCAVTARAEAEGRRLARNLVRAARDAARVVVTGCAATVSPDAFAGLGALAVPDKARLARDPFGPHTAAPRAPGEFPDLAVTGYDRARALVKVQDGCSHGCSYCIVPAARGPSVSRPLADVLAEVRRLLAAGHREIGLTGINLGHYGRDLAPAMDFWDLVADLDAALAPEHAGTARLRLGSLDPAMLTGRGLAVLAGSRLVCPHLHISLQSADPAVLTAMGRRPGDAEAVSFFVDSISREWPAMGLGLDLLTGFPGESEAAFAATAAFLDGLPATYAHVFPYSRRPGTRAAALPGQLPGPVKAGRARLLREAAEAKSAAFAARLGREASLLVAVERTGPTSGTCAQYVDCRFEAGPDAPLGSLVAARPLGVDGPVLRVAPLGPGDRP